IDTGLHVLNIHDPVHPSVVGRYDIGQDGQLTDTPNVLQVIGNVAYILNGNAELQVLDLTDLAHPSLVATFGPQEPANAKGVRVVGNRDYLVGERPINDDDDIGFLQLFDETEPTNLTQIGFSDIVEIHWGVDAR